MSTYLYGIIRRPAPDSGFSSRDLDAGVGDPPASVYLLRYRELAAVLSEVAPDEIGEAAGVRALRRDMAAHADLLNRALERVPALLPVRFGIVLPHEDALVEQV